METFKSNRSFCNFYPTLPKTFFILKMSKLASFKYSKWKTSNQLDSGTFVKIITRKFVIKNIQGFIQMRGEGGSQTLLRTVTEIRWRGGGFQ